MKYIIKNKIISWGAGSTVRDEAGNDLYTVKGSLSFVRKKMIRDMQGNTLYVVKNKFFHILFPKVFICDAEGKKLMMLKRKKVLTFRNDFSIIPQEGFDCNFSITGDIIARHFDIIENGVQIAHVRQNFNLIKDSFWLETEATDKVPLLLAFVIAIDNFIDDTQDSYR